MCGKSRSSILGALRESDFLEVMLMGSLSTKMIRKALFKRDGTQCTYCNTGLSHKTATIDHIIPIAKGGSRNSLFNMVLACSCCNNAKADKALMKYLRSRKVIYLKPYIKSMGRYLYGRKEKETGRVKAGK